MYPTPIDWDLRLGLVIHKAMLQKGPIHSVRFLLRQLPVAHLPHREFEDPLLTSLQGSPQISISKCTNQVVLIIDNKKAPTSFAS